MFGQFIMELIHIIVWQYSSKIHPILKRFETNVDLFRDLLDVRKISEKMTSLRSKLIIDECK